jgi:hypothetical protein
MLSVTFYSLEDRIIGTTECLIGKNAEGSGGNII